jgi:hypothetical protein
MTFQLDDFRLHRGCHLRPATAATSRPALQAGFSLLAVHAHPLRQGAEAHAHFAGHLLHGEAFFQTELNCFASDLKRVGIGVRTNCPARCPPRGACPPALPLNSLYAFHR